MERTTEGADAVHRMKRTYTKKVEAPEVVEAVDNSAAQAYGLRIWHGQSVDLPIAERVQRVVNGLRGQSMSIDVNLPHPDAARFLAKHQ